MPAGFFPSGLFIPGNVASSKNSKQAFIDNKGKQRVMMSDYAQDYSKNTFRYYQDKAHLFQALLEGKKKPYRIALYFVRDTHGRFDFHNACQLPFDLMQEHGWLEDDNAATVLPFPQVNPHGYAHHVDKEKPGVYIQVL